MKPGAWIQEVQGKPWVIGARGPDAFDCYGLYYYVRKTFFGEEVPICDETDYAGLPDLSLVFRKHLHRWESVEVPFEGCGVAMSKSNRFTHHCGVWTTADRGLVVHASEGAKGILAQSLKDLKQRGWKQIDFFRFNPNL